MDGTSCQKELSENDLLAVLNHESGENQGCLKNKYRSVYDVPEKDKKAWHLHAEGNVPKTIYVRYIVS